MGAIQEVVIGHDEVEAMRLKNLLGFPQEEAANQMGVSQPTFHRLINAAHQKITDAIINGKALRIEGGNVSIEAETPGPCHWRKDWGRGCASAEAIAALQVEKDKPEEGRIPNRIAITSSDGTLDGTVDERFGRAKNIVVIDLDTSGKDTIDNTANLGAPQGAGIRTASNIIEAGARTVISGHLGPNAFRVLSAAGVEVYTAPNLTAREALESYKRGTLSRLAGADVDGHW
jgi:predicted Fe-Mo cluster-binding NifX family protein/predicted DNA-binding protein (UPF0251 family)